MTEGNEIIMRKRLLILNAARLAGAILIAVGTGIIVNRFMDLPLEMGYFIFAIGVFEFILLPKYLARKWKTPPRP